MSRDQDIHDTLNQDDPLAEVGPDFRSPDQVAVVWFRHGEVVVASPTASDSPGAYDLDLTKIPSDFNIGAAVSMRRATELGLTPLSEKTQFVTVLPDFAERTQVMALDAVTRSLDDESLITWLIEAERKYVNGTDDHPLFETPLEETACSVLRLPDNNIALTEAPREFLNNVRSQIESFTGIRAEDIKLTVETPSRAALRYFLAATVEGEKVLDPDHLTEVTAIIVIGRTGFSFALWNPRAGLFTEYGFPAPAELKSDELAWNALFNFEASETNANVDEQQVLKLKNELDLYIRQAFDQLLLQLSPETAGELGMSSFARIIWATERDLDAMVTEIARDYENYSGTEFIPIGVASDEAIASGLLLGSFSFGAETVVGAEILPQVDLAKDLAVLADKEELERLRIEQQMLERRQKRAGLALAAPPVIVIALIIGFAVNNIGSQILYGFRESAADQRTAELKPALDRRLGYEAKINSYKEFIKLVGELRKQQPVAMKLLFQLNDRYPLDIDPGFFVGQLEMDDKGQAKMSGLARNPEAVTRFLKSLETARDEDDGELLFQELTYSVREPGASSNNPAMGRNFDQKNSMFQNTAPGVIQWNMTAFYLPVMRSVPEPEEPAKGKKKPAAKPKA
jgi:hypothetical protein